MVFEVNEYQTPLTDDLLDSLHKEVREDLIDSLTNIEFIRRLVSPDRKKAKDLPRDKDGKIIVDVANPHIIEDMEYFRPTGRYFREHGVLTHLRPNPNPNSEFRKWIDRETDRCWNGMVRPSDGEWVTGDMYFYLNYVPILQSRSIDGSRRAQRIYDFPECWEATYLWFHYVEQARSGGIYDDFKGGSHCVHIARRGIGKAHPYSQDVLTPTGWKKWGDIKIGDLLYGDDGKPTKVIDIPFDEESDIYELTLIDGRRVRGSLDHLWKIIRKGKEQILSTRDIIDSYRSKRIVSWRNPNGVEHKLSIPVNSPIEMPEQAVPIDPYTMGLILGDGCLRMPKAQNYITFTCRSGDLAEYKKNIPYEIDKISNDKYTYAIRIQQAGSILKLLGLSMKKSEDKFIPSIYLNNSYENRLSLLCGLMDSDGYINNHGSIDFSTSSYQMSQDFQFLCRSLGLNTKTSIKKCHYKKDGVKIECLDSFRTTIHSNIQLFRLSRKLERIHEKTSRRRSQRVLKTSIIDVKYVGREKSKCVSVDNRSNCYLIGDFVVTHNSFSSAAMLAKLFIVGESKEVSRSNRGVAVSFKSEYLTKDGILNKFVDAIDFCAEHTHWPHKRLKTSMQEMLWKMGYLDSDTGVMKGTLNEVLGVTTKDDSDKVRGKRAQKIIFEEFGANANFLETWNTTIPSVQEGDFAFGQLLAQGTGGTEGCLTENNIVFTRQGVPKSVKDICISDGILGYDVESQKTMAESIKWINNPSTKDCVKIITNSGRHIECSLDHPIYSSSHRSKSQDKRVWQWIQAGELKVGDILSIAQDVPYFLNKPIFDARLIGMLIGDGSYISSPRIHSCDSEIKDYVKGKYEWSSYSKPYQTKDGRVFETIGIKKIRDNLRELGIYGQSGSRKRLPSDIFKASKEDVSDLIGGLIDTDGNVYVQKGRRAVVSLSMSGEDLAKDVQMLLMKIGVYSNILIKKPSKNKKKKIEDKNKYYSVEISTRDGIINLYKNVSLLTKYKQEKLQEAYSLSLKKKRWRSNKFEYETIKKIEYIGERVVYNLSAHGTSTYLANGIITHNSDFTGALEIIYNPVGYNVYPLPNVFDRNSQGKTSTVFFSGGYLNRKGFYNKDGVSDVVGALISILEDRVNLKYNSTDPMAITRRKAEIPITIQDAIMQITSTIYPVADLTDRLNQIDLDPKSLDDVLVGDLSLKDGVVEFKPSMDLVPVRNYPHKDNKMDGAVEIFKMPELDKNGKAFRGRYIAGCLPSGEIVSTLEGPKEIQNVQINDRLINIDGIDVGINQLQKFYVEDTLHDISISNILRRTKITGEHPVYSATPKRHYRGAKTCKRTGLPQRYDILNFGFKEARHLKVGDILKSPNKYKKEKEIPYHLWDQVDIRIDRVRENPLDSEDFWWLVGLWLGDGYCNKSIISICVNKKEQLLADKVQRVMGDLFNRKVLILDKKDGAIEATASCIHLTRFLDRNFGKYAHGKYIPEWAKYLPDKLKAAMVQGYLNSDGCVSRNAIEFVSINLPLLESFQDILFSLGLISNLSLLRKAKITTIRGNKVNQRRTYNLRIGKIYSLRLKELINKPDLKLDKILNREYDELKWKRDCWFDENQDYIYFKIKDIKKSFIKGTVYNFSCETNTYMCNWIPTHNCDTFDDDHSNTLSLGAIKVLDLWTDRLVAQYTGRRQFADEFFEICRRLTMFYNGSLLYENNKKGLFGYFQKMNSLYLLSEVPEYLRDKDLVKGAVYGNKLYGAPSTAPIKAYGRRALRDWLLKPQTEVIYDEDGNPMEVTFPLLMSLKSRSLIQELTLWNADANFDEHDAMIMLMLLREQELIIAGEDGPKERDSSYDASYLGNDEFFTNNYDKRFNKGPFENVEIIS